MASNILVIPDYHAIPGVDNKRATLLGKHICEWKPDIVVCLGDWWDLPSLCKWSKKFELKQALYWDDIDVGLDAMELMFTPVRAAKKKLPRFVFLRGNHENRVFDLAADLPIYEGVIGPQHFELEQWGWEVHDYKTDVEIEGWLFTHAFPSGAMGNPIGCKHTGNKIIDELKTSGVQGHNHVFDHKVMNDGKGNAVHGITAGCFVHPTHKEAWNRNTRKRYHLGVLHLTNAADGDASVAWVRMEDM